MQRELRGVPVNPLFHCISRRLSSSDVRTRPRATLRRSPSSLALFRLLVVFLSLSLSLAALEPLAVLTVRRERKTDKQ